jgi:hypothetical protein
VQLRLEEGVKLTEEAVRREVEGLIRHLKAALDKELAQFEAANLPRRFSGLIVERLVGVLGPWFSGMDTSRELCRGTGGLGPGSLNGLVGVPNTVILVETQTGAVVGGYLRPPWTSGTTSAPGDGAVIFALRSSSTTTPVKFPWTGSGNVPCTLDASGSMLRFGCSGGPTDLTISSTNVQVSNHATCGDRFAHTSGGRGPTFLGVEGGEGSIAQAPIGRWEVWALG